MNGNTIFHVVWFVIMLFIFLPVIAVAAFSPQTIVRWQAQFYRTAYKTMLKRSDEEIDQPFQFPWDRALMGRRSEFIVRGNEAPESYTGLLKGYRIFGVIGLVMFGCVFSIAIMWVLSTFLKTL